MNSPVDILCIGSVLWDIIGRTPAHMAAGADVPGRIARLPGGVAMNLAMTFARFGLRPALLTAIGRDAEGEELIRAAAYQVSSGSSSLSAPEKPQSASLPVFKVDN